MCGRFYVDDETKTIYPNLSSIKGIGKSAAKAISEIAKNGSDDIVDIYISTNGTKINGKQIEPNKFCKLNDKDEISFSPVDIYIYVEKKDEEIFYCYNCGRKIIKNNDKLPLICSYCNFFCICKVFSKSFLPQIIQIINFKEFLRVNILITRLESGKIRF